MRRAFLTALLSATVSLVPAQLLIGPQFNLGGDMIALGIEARSKNNFSATLKCGYYSWYSKSIMAKISKDFKVFGDNKPWLGISIEHINAFKGTDSYDKGSMLYTNESSRGEYIMGQLRIISNPTFFVEPQSGKTTREMDLVFFYLGYSHAIHRVQITQVGQYIDPDGVGAGAHRLRSKVCFGVGMSVVFGPKARKEVSD